MVKLALIGLGRWGTNIKNTLESVGGVEVVTFEKDAVPLTPALAKKQGIQAVIVATPGSTHADIALPFIKKGLPVYVEKPMATSVKDALKIQRAAQKSGANVFVGHLHLYNPAFLKTKELVKEVGKIRYVSFQGMNWGPFRDDMSAWWDWAPHDIYMALDLFGNPKSIQAWGEYDWAMAKLEFPDNVVATMHVTSLSAQKRKQMMMAGTKCSIVFDDTAEQKIAVHRKGAITYLDYEKEMPLTAEMKAFVEMVTSGKPPRTDLQNGVDVVRILDAGERSMKKQGKLIAL